MQAENTGNRLSFGPFDFDPVSGELRRHGVPLKLQRQPARVLKCLLEKPGQIVLREAIRQAAWGDKVVDFDKSLNFCISQIRHALGDSPQAPTYIETIPGVGYRFRASVSSTQDKVTGWPQAWRRKNRLIATAVVAAGVILPTAVVVILSGGGDRSLTLAVAPLEQLDLGAAPVKQDLLVGLSEELTAELVNLRPGRLNVIETSSLPRPLAEAGSKKFDYVLEGTVHNQAQGINIVLRLVRGDDGTSVWAQRFAIEKDQLPERLAEVARSAVSSMAKAVIIE